MSSAAVKICFVTFQSGFVVWVFFFPPHRKIYSGFVWIIEGEGWVLGWRVRGGAGCSREQFKVHSLFACNKKSSVIRYLNPNQQFHIRNLS